LFVSDRGLKSLHCLTPFTSVLFRLLAITWSSRERDGRSAHYPWQHPQVWNLLPADLAFDPYFQKTLCVVCLIAYTNWAVKQLCSAYRMRSRSKGTHYKCIFITCTHAASRYCFWRRLCVCPHEVSKTTGRKSINLVGICPVVNARSD